MKAILYDKNGGPEALYLGEAPDPVIKPSEVLIANVATSINRADLLQLSGNYPGYGKPGEILGLDLAGTVIEVGAEVSGLTVGDNVCALVDGGGYAQLAAVPAAMCLKLPGNLSFTKAAAVPEAYIVAFQALRRLGNLQEGQDILVHAGASGVGTALIQLAKVSDARVYATASSGKLSRLLELGADVCIDYKSQDFAATVLEHTNGRGVDLVVDFVGATYAERNLRALATDGTLVLLGMLGGASADGFSPASILLKRLTLAGSTLRNRSGAYKEALVADFREQVWPLFADRTLQPVVDTIFDWEDLRSGMDYMLSNANVGKLVVTIGD